MTSPALIVNDIFAWLNGLFELRIPLLPLKGWPSAMKTLWNMFIGGSPPPTSPPEVFVPSDYQLLWEIPIEGTLAVFPPGSKVELEHLCIFVQQKDS
ncbi:MAG: hypothetical protein AUG51_09280 [Acidobacteria bacterium 13_1_20CM_3_53_8]|nr:MAG: hypothetical protein AUG51_09280 [Acidobacteria bacterium 13_1_20CM_3_53_8]